MADTINKPKLQLRSGISVNGDKTPSPATKLLINHGKPNFTIQRSPKVQQNGEGNPLTIQVQDNTSNNNNNNDSSFKNANGNGDIVVKSTKFNGVFKPANIPMAEKQPHQQQTSTENEAAKVVLRRTKVAAELPLKDGEDDSVPEFIRRQRRIQERLAKENVLDFENRRSGYFTHVLISPTSVNRTSFAETMSSPAIVPSLEMAPPAKKEETVTEVEDESEPVTVTSVAIVATNGDSNGHVEEEEVAKAIEEVNKAVAGEDDDKIEEEEEVQETPIVAAAVTIAHLPEPTLEEESAKKSEEKVVEPVVAVAVTTLEHIEEPVTVDGLVEESSVAHEETKEEKDSVVHAQAVVATLESSHEVPVVAVATTHDEPQQNGHHHDEPKENGHATNGTEGITISHTNGNEGPSIPSPDPSGALGVNYESKTVVSFSKDLGEPNKYPDTVKVVKDGDSAGIGNEELQDLAKLKFEINTEDNDVQVTSVLKTE